MTNRWIRALGYFPVYVALIGLAAGLWSRPGLLTASYAVLAALMLARWHSSSDVGFFFLSSILGPLGEIVCIRFGAWQYALPWIDIPFWLPLGWGIAGLYLKKSIEVLTSAERERR